MPYASVDRVKHYELKRLAEQVNLIPNYKNSSGHRERKKANDGEVVATVMNEHRCTLRGRSCPANTNLRVLHHVCLTRPVSERVQYLTTAETQR